MINNDEELLTEAKKIENIEDRTRYIMNYFLENVKYNYAYLFVKGYTQGSISRVSNNYNIITNKAKTDGDEEFAVARSINEGESRIFDDILKIRDENDGNYSKFTEQLRNYITLELKKHLANDKIVNGNVDLVLEKIEKGLREKGTFNYKGNEFKANYDISKVLIDFLLKPKEYFPPEFNNGLITNGVCADYTNYLVPLLQKAGIESYSVEGKSEFGHAWVIVRDGERYKSIDLTRAVFIRDGSLETPQGQTSEDWLYSDLKDIFKMQNARTITKIDRKELPNAITAQNFDEATFIKMMQEQKITDSTFKNLVKKGLKKGITEGEILNVDQAEIKAEREDKTNE